MKYLLFAIILSGLKDLVAMPMSFVPPDSTRRSDSFVREKWIDSLTRVLDRADDKTRFDIEFQLFGIYIDHDIERASHHLDQCKLLASQYGNSLWIVKTLHAVGHLSQREDNLQNAIKSFEDALAIARRNHYQDRIKYLLNSLTLAYTSNHQIDKALRYSLESLRIREVEGDPGEISTALLNNGNIYVRLGVFDEALKYFQRSYEIKKKNKIDHDLELLKLNICSVLLELGNYQEAEHDALAILKLCSGGESCRSSTLKHLKLVLGISLVHQNRNLEGTELLQEVLEMSRKDRVSEIRASAYYWLSRIKFKNGLLNDAMSYLDSGEAICFRADYKIIRLNNLGLYAELSAARRDFLSAFAYQKQESQLRTELFNGKLVKSFSAIEAKQLEQENHLKIVSQERELKLKETTIEQNRVIFVEIGVIVLLLVVLSMFLIKNNKQKGKINELLSERVWERTRDLESSRGGTFHSKEELRVVVGNLMNNLVASEATFKGLTHLVKLDLPEEQVIYFQNAEMVLTKMTNYLRTYKDQFTQTENPSSSHYHQG